MVDEPIEGEVISKSLTHKEEGLPPLPILAKDHPIAGKVVKHLLKAPDKRLLKARPGGGNLSFTYLPWSWYVRRLVEAFGSYSMVDLEFTERPCLDRQGLPTKDVEVGCSLTLLLGPADSPFSRLPGVGSMIFYPKNAGASFSNAKKGAISDALKNAAGRAGLALDLYQDEAMTPAEMEAQEAEARWKAALKVAQMPEAVAIRKLSEVMTGEAGALTTIDDLLTATGVVGPAAFDALVEKLEVKSDGTTEKP